MGAGVFTNNTTIKISSGSSGTKTSAGTFFTTGSTEYAIVSVSAGTSDVTSVCTVGSASYKLQNNGGTQQWPIVNLYVPPSTAFAWSSGTIHAAWTIFTNSP